MAKRLFPRQRPLRRTAGGSPHQIAAERVQAEDLGGSTKSQPLPAGSLPNAIGKGRPRCDESMVFATQSTHKLLAGLSQASQILVQESQTRLATHPLAYLAGRIVRRSIVNNYDIEVPVGLSANAGNRSVDRFRGVVLHEETQV